MTSILFQKIFQYIRSILIITFTTGLISSTASAADSTELRVGVASRLGQDLQFKVSGVENNLPYKIKWINFDAAPPAMDALLADSIDTFWGGDTPAVFIAYNKRDVKVVAANQKGLFGALLVAKDSPITSVEQLKGKRIAVYRGSGFQNSLLSILKYNGLSDKDVTFSYVSPSEGLAALISGSVDAWGIWDPNAAIAEKSFGARILATPKVFSYGLQFASSKTLADKQKSDALQDFLLRSYKATEWVRNHPKEWAEIQSKQGDIRLDAAQLAASRTGGQFVPVNKELISSIQGIADNFHKLGIIDQAVDVSNVFDTRYSDFLEKQLEENN
ncbi:TPA: aliphatic sulfonate ABC transporter substrate-binding protein [Klebsiella pneumoniae]|nr:aliphatic sulfonate ABC transporter substrate-binding protein [Klebsiella pneumoniae]